MPKTQSMNRSQREEYRSLKALLAKRFGWRCWYCGARLAKDSGQVDHIVAKASGGTEALGNLALTCEWCNRAKSYQPLDSFMNWIEWLRSGNSFTPFNMTVEEADRAAYKSLVEASNANGG